MIILVTGGLGFIGSHTVVELLESDYEVIIVDNLVNSSVSVLKNITKITNKRPKFYNVDVTVEEDLRKIFNEHKFDGIIHFAGLKSVGESVKKPIDYYYNNLVSTLVLSKLAIQFDVPKFIFSSSATVYGNQESPLVEDAKLEMTTNPYGETKSMSERILTDITISNPNIHITLLRYFNPIGAHESGLIGERPNGIPNNLLPYVAKVAKGELALLSIFGNDYDTIDGTGVRDYIHVVDLARGHVKALENCKDSLEIYNLGTGNGTSVLEIIQVFEKMNHVMIPYKIVERRAGDIGTCYASVEKAKSNLDWEAQLTIEDMVKDAWYFEKLNG